MAPALDLLHDAVVGHLARAEHMFFLARGAFVANDRLGTSWHARQGHEDVKAFWRAFVAWQDEAECSATSERVHQDTVAP